MASTGPAVWEAAAANSPAAEGDLLYPGSAPRSNTAFGYSGGEQERKDTGQARLEELGYHQELQRRFGAWSSCSAGFAFMSFLLGITASFPTAFSNGGPLVVISGWILASIANVLVAASLAEIASCYPLAGGPYFWCLELLENNPRYTLLAFATGYLNMLGQAATLAAGAYLTADCVNDVLQMSGGAVLTPMQTFALFAGTLVLCGMLGSMPTETLRRWSLLIAYYLAISGMLIGLASFLVAPERRPLQFLLTSSDNKKLQQARGIESRTYMWALGLAAAHFSFIGFEGPAQLSEETKRADKNVPFGMVWSVLWTAVLGLVFNIAILLSMPAAFDDLVGEGTQEGHLICSIIAYNFKEQFNMPEAGAAAKGAILVAILGSNVICVAMSARMLWSFSREGGVLWYRVWASVDKRTGIPLNATWAMVGMAMLMGLPLLQSFDAFYNIMGIAYVNLNLSYSLPVLLRLIRHRTFVPGPFKLGRAGPLINVGALLSLCLAVGAFCLPQKFPLSTQNFDWTPMSVALVLGAVMAIWFFPKHGACHWYHGRAFLSNDTHIRGGGRYQNGQANYGQDEVVPLSELISHLMAKCEAQSREAGRQLSRALSRRSVSTYAQQHLPHYNKFRPGE